MPKTHDPREDRGTQWRPLAGASLMERLRVTGRSRPAADPVAARDLRAMLESGLADGVSTGDDGRLIVTKERLTRSLSCPVHRTVDRFGERVFTLPLACGALVDVLFRQLVTVGAVGDAMADALEGLAMDDRQAPLVAWIGGLAPAESAELRAEVDRQARGLSERWPVLRPSWSPRTHESLRVLLAGGAVELSARVDLAVGPPPVDEASVALVEVKSGTRRPEHRHDAAYYALVEALRSPAPPFAVATYYSRTGELDVVPVTHELLVEAARRCLAGTQVLAGLVDRPADGSWCTACAAVLPSAAGPRNGADAVDPDGPRAAGAVSLVRLAEGRAA